MIAAYCINTSLLIQFENFPSSLDVFVMIGTGIGIGLSLIGPVFISVIV